MIAIGAGCIGGGIAECHKSMMLSQRAKQYGEKYVEKACAAYVARET